MRRLKIISYFCLSLVTVIGFITIVASGGGGGGGGNDGGGSSDTTTFSDNGGTICTESDKPVIRMFSTSTCPHCAWSAQAFDQVVQTYVNQGLIVAHHWEYDNITQTWDDLLTNQVEGTIPASEMDIYDTYSGGYVPTFVFGCRYTRVGNGYEAEDDLDAEEAEFIDIIEELLDSLP